MSVNLHAMSDLCTPWCLHVAVTLLIAEHIAEGHTSIADLAAAAQCDARNLHAMLSHLVSKGVFEQPEPGRFALNDAARGLLEPATRIGLDLNGIGGRMAGVWGTMLNYVRTGKTAYHEAFGLPFWEDLDTHPQVAESFDDLIGAVGHPPPNPNFEITGGWDDIKTVVDVGGGTGGMLTALLELRPHIKGTLVELPGTVARAPKQLDTRGQSFFDPLPAGADLYLLRGVLNNWPDPDAIKLLKRCAEAAARPHGRLVILKSVGPNDEPVRLSVDQMLTGGRHRTADEFRTLAQASGLEIVAAAQQSAYFVVECRPL